MNIPAIQLSPAAKAILAQWEAMPTNILQAIAAGMDYQNALTKDHITNDYMSFSKAGPASPIGTRVQSNLLRGTMRFSKARIEGQVVTSGIGSNVKYAAAMEFGSEPHRIEAKGKALRFFAAGKPVFCKWVNHPGTKPREFTQRGIADTIPDYGRQISRRIVGAMKGEGK